MSQSNDNNPKLPSISKSIVVSSSAIENSLPSDMLAKLQANFEAERITPAAELLQEDLNIPIAVVPEELNKYPNMEAVSTSPTPTASSTEESSPTIMKTSTEWNLETRVIRENVICVETDTGGVKKGDGISSWNALPYLAVPRAMEVIPPVESPVEEATVAVEEYKAVLDSPNQIDMTADPEEDDDSELEDALTIETEIEEVMDTNAPKIDIPVEAPAVENAPAQVDKMPELALHHPLSTEEQMVQLFHDLSLQYGSAENFYKAQANGDETALAIAQCVNQFRPQRDFSDTALRLAVREGKLDRIIELNGKKIRDGIISKNLLKGKPSGSRVSGDAAIKLAMATTQGIMKVNFYNSGFWVNIRPSALVELNTLFNSIRSANKEYEKEFGALYYIPADKKIKQEVLSLFESLVIDSNLHNYNKPGVLMEAMAFPDHIIAMWAVACLMFREGVKVKYLCAEKGCGHVHTTTVDLLKMRWNNYRLLSAEQIAYCNSDDKRTVEELATYRANLKLDERVVLDDTWSVVQDVCVMADWFRFANEYNAKMLATLQDKSEESIAEYIESSQNRIVVPWTKEIVITENGVEAIIADKTVFPGVMDALQLHESKILSDSYVRLSTRIEEYIQKTAISHICYTFTQCPKCKAVPSAAVNNLISCDVQTTFFTLLTMRLMRK